MVNRTKYGIISAPIIPNRIPQDSKWLAGQGAGSWFHISLIPNNSYSISRFSPHGNLEFHANFKISGNKSFSINRPFAFTYLCHNKFCHIIQHGQKIKFINELYL